MRKIWKQLLKSQNAVFQQLYECGVKSTPQHKNRQILLNWFVPILTWGCLDQCSWASKEEMRRLTISESAWSVALLVEPCGLAVSLNGDWKWLIKRLMARDEIKNRRLSYTVVVLLVLWLAMSAEKIHALMTATFLWRGKAYYRCQHYRYGARSYFKSVMIVGEAAYLTLPWLSRIWSIGQCRRSTWIYWKKDF